MKTIHISPHKNFTSKFIIPLIDKQTDSNQEVYSNTNLPKSGKNLDIKIKKNIFITIINILKLVRLVRKEKINLIYCHTTVDSFLTIILLRILTSSKIYYINHGVPYIGYKGIFKYILYLFEVSNVNLSHKAFTITPSMLPPLKKCILYRNKHIKVLTPGTIAGVEHEFETYDDLIKIKKSNNKNELIILYVGRPEKRKGLFDIIDAVKYLNFEFKLFLIGVNESDISHLTYNKLNIIPTGYINDPTNYFRIADILCVPSLHEGFGQVYLEAASYGVIPISCDIPGPTDFIKNKINGFCVTKNSPKVIAKILIEIYNNPSLKKKISENAFLSSIKYNRQTVLNENIKTLL